jgi:serine/threonine protein kinase
MNERIGKYRILGRLCRGGMGTVFTAHDPSLDRLVAVKIISGETDVTEELRTRFYREAQACARLSHPNITLPRSAPPPKADPQEDIRKVLEDYKRAIESKDLTLFLLVRPVTGSEARKAEASFKQSRSQRVELIVQNIDVSGDQAEARGRRRDEFVSGQGQKFENETAFLFRLRRTEAGWVIADVK